MSSLTRFDGELMIDHRSCDGITPEHARSVGLDGVPLGRNTFNTVPTLGCNHCGSVVAVNPNRKRAREYCRTCDHYICDHCHAARTEADYVHRTTADIIEAVKSGRYELSGDLHRPILIPIGALNGG